LTNRTLTPRSLSARSQSNRRPIDDRITVNPSYPPDGSEPIRLIGTPAVPAGPRVIDLSEVASEVVQTVRHGRTARTMRSPSTDRVEVPFSARFHFASTGRHPDGTPVEGLQMVWTRETVVTGFEHRPVMLAEILELLSSCPEGVLLDATVGGGGHSKALLDAAPQLSVIGLDQDPDAVDAARETLAPYGPRAIVVRSRFDRFADALAGLGIRRLSAALFDLGVSSHQLDRVERGFSYRGEAPLDMRMDPSAGLHAGDIVNTWSEQDLARLFRDNGESRFAGRIARAIVSARPLQTTTQLADVVRSAIPAPARRRGGHPARRVFQAVRVAVNEELEVLPGTLDRVIEHLVPGGRCAVLAYHSGEDRIVKERFGSAATGGCVCPPGLPCVCGAQPKVRLLTRGARKPTAAEVAANHRAESARLRAVEALAPGGDERTAGSRW
jgi:16S rRNA (cytosine1402-N4)-methyltransferase